MRSNRAARVALWAMTSTRFSSLSFLHRLSNRRPRNRELCGNGLFVKSLAGLDDAAQDQAPDDPVNLRTQGQSPVDISGRKIEGHTEILIS